MRKFITFFLVAMMAFSALALSACGGADLPTGSLSFEAGYDNVVITKGESKVLLFKSDFSASAKWESADPTIATVLSGRVEGKKLGTTKIKLTMGAKSIEATVRVNAEIRVPETVDLLLFAETLTALNDKYATTTITPDFVPAITSADDFEFEVDDEEVIEVEDVTEGNGRTTLKITALAEGTATITYKHTGKVDGLDRDIATTVVKVTEAQETAELTFKVRVPTALEAYQGIYMAGNIEGWGGSFANNAEAFAFTKSATDNKLYTLTLHVDLTDTTTQTDPDKDRNEGGAGTQADPIVFPGRILLFKFVMISVKDGAPFDFSWSNEEQIDKNREFLMSGGKATLEYEIASFKGQAGDPSNIEQMNLTISVTFPSAVISDYDLYVVGALAIMGDKWDKFENLKFTTTDHTTFTLTLTNFRYYKNSPTIQIKLLLIKDAQGNIWTYQSGKDKGEGSDPDPFVIDLSELDNNTAVIDNTTADFRFNVPTT